MHEHKFWILGVFIGHYFCYTRDRTEEKHKSTVAAVGYLQKIIDNAIFGRY